MGSLADLVGPVVDLVPPLNVEVGTILLTLNKGAPRQVVHPGRKLRRGKGLPLTWAPQGVAISTEDVPITVTVKGIALRGSFALPQLELAIRIRVDDRDDFVGLRSYVRRKGINFAALLDDEVCNELDALAREAFKDHDMPGLYERGNLTGLLDTTVGLLDSLFRIEAVVRVQPTWHPEFITAREAAASAERATAEKLLEINQLPLDRALAANRDQLLQDAADRRGMSLAAFEDPELLDRAEQRHHELRLEMIKQADSLRRAGLVGEVQAVLDEATQEPPRLTAAAVPAAAAGGAGRPPEAGDLSVSLLRRDPTLARIWRKSGLPGEPAGLAVADHGESATLVVVLKELADGTLRAAIEQVRVQSQTEAVITIDEASSVQDVVERYLLKRVPELAKAEPAVALQVEGSRLVVTLASVTARLGHQLRIINDPDERVLEPLAAVLPYDVIDVELAEPS